MANTLDGKSFTLFEYADTEEPAVSMWVHLPSPDDTSKSQPIQLLQDDLDQATEDEFEVQTEVTAQAETTTLRDLGILDFDAVFLESMRWRHTDVDQEALEAALKDLVAAAKTLTSLGLSIVVGFRTNEDEEMPPVTIRATRG
ncbi:hypothetical protein [Tropicimonas marinistellae]|uniref:hypothetical protein n=1 Tax=Tropicimonas marinistellae TaxID=1739787 RepID=UPI0008342295|nr:hypothetical protein [Tropicimonas marinistellae]